MSREILQISAKGVLRRLPGPGIGDREARYGVSFRLSDPGGSLGRDAEHFTLEKPGSISLSADRSSNRTVGGCWRTAVVRGNMRELAISMLET